MAKETLKGWQVVIMRPSHQAQSLIEAVKSYGGAPYFLPLMEIQPLALTATQCSQAKTMANLCYVIVTSANAVYCTPEEILNILRSRETPLVTMGKATTQALNEKDLRVFFTAPLGSTSETLLQQSFLNTEVVQGQTILLLAGEGGRTVLAETLKERGADIVWLKTYRQYNTPVDIVNLLQLWQENQRYCFVATSSRVLASLRKLVSTEHFLWLQACPCIVVSERIALQAREYGFQHIFVAKAPHTDEILESLQEMAQLCTMR